MAKRINREDRDNLNNEEKRICAQNDNLPKVTVLSIDPKTGEPYLTLDHLQQMADYHTSRYAQNLLMKIDHEDIKQELILKMLVSAFNPELSAAKTFTIRCFQSQCARIYEREFKVRAKNKEMHDFYIIKDDGDPVLATETLGVDHCTPEDYLMAGDTVAASNGRVPHGFVGHRGTVWEGTRAPTKKKHKKRK